MRSNTAVLIGAGVGVIVVVACMLVGAVLYPPIAAPMISGASVALGLLGAKAYKEVRAFLATPRPSPATSPVHEVHEVHEVHDVESQEMVTANSSEFSSPDVSEIEKTPRHSSGLHPSLIHEIHMFRKVIEESYEVSRTPPSYQTNRRHSPRLSKL